MQKVLREGSTVNSESETVPKVSTTEVANEGTENVAESDALKCLELQLDYAKHAGDVYWARFNIFSAMSGALLVAWTKTDTRIEGVVVCVAGILISFAWASINARAALYFRHAMKEVKALAKNTPLDYFKEGLSRREWQELLPRSQLFRFIVKWFANFSMTWVAIGVSVAFLFVWIALLIYGVVGGLTHVASGRGNQNSVVGVFDAGVEVNRAVLRQFPEDSALTRDSGAHDDSRSEGIPDP